MKKIVIINGHPNKDSYNAALAKAYQTGAVSAGAEVKDIAIGELAFNPNLAQGYQQRTELEPDLLEALEKIKWADHLVWIHPVWWGGLPAITKGFIDRLFLPGIAFSYRENSVWCDKHFKGKTAHIITTLDTPSWFYKLVNSNASVNQLKVCILVFCGINKVKVTYFGPIRNSKEADRAKWLEKTKVMGIKLK